MLLGGGITGLLRLAEHSSLHHGVIDHSGCGRVQYLGHKVDSFLSLEGIHSLFDVDFPQSCLCSVGRSEREATCRSLESLLGLHHVSLFLAKD
jgi:hypothetical protein